MKKTLPHLYPALAALAIVAGVLLGGNWYATRLETRYVNSLAPLQIRQGDVGIALQEAAFQQPSLLPVFGSSEMNKEDDENIAHRFFQTYPTGFTVFDIAHGGMTSLEIAQNLAAIGPELKGKQVVISFTPSMFGNPEQRPHYYAGNFSTLHANEMAFSPYLSLKLKQQAAIRMLQYPETLIKDPLLKFALENLAGSSARNFCLYYLVMPLGRLQILIIRLQDQWEMLNWFYANSQALFPVTRKTYSIDWQADLSQAIALQKKDTSSNPYGIENRNWRVRIASKFSAKIPPGSMDEAYIGDVGASKEWDDFNILLSTLQELGARPLIMSRPINGTIEDALGVSAKARTYFYNKLQKAVRPYGFPLVEYSEQDNNRLFSIDANSHTSRVGWIYIDQTLDAFYHGQIH